MHECHCIACMCIVVAYIDIDSLHVLPPAELTIIISSVTWHDDNAILMLILYSWVHCMIHCVLYICIVCDYSSLGCIMCICYSTTCWGIVHACACTSIHIWYCRLCNFIIILYRDVYMLTLYTRSGTINHYLNFFTDNTFTPDSAHIPWY